MWAATEGLVVLIAVILLFGIISLPPRPKKTRQAHDLTEITEPGIGHSMTRISDDQSQQGVSGGAVLSDSAAQHVSADPTIAARGI